MRSTNDEGKKENSLSRRRFLRRATMAGAAALAAPAIVPSSVFGALAPSDRIAIGCIGVGRMGLGDMQSFMGIPGVEILAVCDPDSNRTKYAREIVQKGKQRGAKGG
ncbi:MAG TPA: twin-arginine translocation signal domain-containing protein, partial [Sumerlaeia bacterium]|nr:twin-arginine translocation signal domain-containing protein [Sumerlaeia bacterium]